MWGLLSIQTSILANPRSVRDLFQNMRRMAPEEWNPLAFRYCTHTGKCVHTEILMFKSSNLGYLAVLALTNWTVMREMVI